MLAKTFDFETKKAHLLTRKEENRINRIKLDSFLEAFGVGEIKVISSSFEDEERFSLVELAQKIAEDDFKEKVYHDFLEIGEETDSVLEAESEL
ncbi:MAG: hypothetical protein PHE89_04950 [Alphaproteobacteria bacterium]|nr:hypothetical protein [Alphaproteobacteria bacterium]